MDPSVQPLLRRLENLSEQFRELREGVQKAVLVADLDPEMALTRARKVLELVVREVYERRCHEPPGTRPLENLIQRLVKDGFFPDRLDAYAATVRKLGNVGTHTFGERITAADVYQSLTQLMPILEWYFEVERPEAKGRSTAPAEAHELAGSRPADPSRATPPPRIAVIPKGLRSFDANDADFFLDLLPGPRDKDGLPESIRFWKHRIEAGDEPTFTVGVIYGPSGCGKSSLVKAGLLPRLARRVLSVYVEATADDTEARLLQGLRKRCPELPGDLDLTGSMTALRQGQGWNQGRKVLIVLDQFEQWLHARRGEPDAELAQALRQCDGENVQCVLLVRDDFWVALSRFMAALNIELLQGQNIALVDLFDPIHARNVLAAFGRAFGRLPDEPSKDQDAFLDQAVQGLAQDGRVISVRLALFAEMVKGKPWTPATLKAVGGTEGVGVVFLEETFNAGRLRPHQQAARAVLKALLPESGADIKGGMRSHDELREASGYARRPKDFEELLRILDGEVRLITPTDLEGKDDAGEPGGVSPRSSDARYYQLTHDYLVPSLRAWLTRKQKETRRGRAELRLADRAALWNARPESRHLPASWEWLNIRLFTRTKDWTPPQRKMMRKAGRYHAVRWLAAALVLVALSATGWLIRSQVVEQGRADHAAALVQRLHDADVAQVPDIVKELQGYRQWTDPLLRQEEAGSRDGSRQKLYASLALLPVDEGQTEYLYQRLLKAGPTELPVIRDALLPQHEALRGHLWAVLEDGKSDADQRFRAACALAAYDVTEDDANRQRWEGVSPFVADQLLAAVQQNPSDYTPLLKTLDPVRGRLVGPLSVVFRSGERAEADRTLAASFLAEYAADEADMLADLLMDADDKQFAVIYPKFKEQGENGLLLLTGEIDKKLPADLPSSDERREKLAKRQANAAVALLRLNQPEKVWPLLKRTPPDDPRVRSYLIHRLSPLGADPQAVIKRLDEEPDVTIRRALLLSLGEYDETGLSPQARTAVLPTLQDLYRNDADPGLHAACEWLLRTWKQEVWLKQANDMWAKDQEERERRIDGIKRLLTKDKEKSPPQWYVNGQGQTMVVIPGPVEFLMGSPATEADRSVDETQHKVRIRRTFALAARPVTVKEFRLFLRENKLEAWFDADGQVPPLMKKYGPDENGPSIYVDWYRAAAYCNWLSKQEDLPECYETDARGGVVKLKENYLNLAGYRLPTEAEWEYACRAGAVTARYYGETAELLGKYAWYLDNSRDRTWPVGRKKPNDLGLFDLQGNVYSWCQEEYAPYGEAIEDKEGDLDIDSKNSRVLRGGSFLYQAVILRSAFRFRDVPTYRYADVGFRPARTFIP